MSTADLNVRLTLPAFGCERQSDGKAGADELVSCNALLGGALVAVK
jgi:hypothetical protein